MDQKIAKDPFSSVSSNVCVYVSHSLNHQRGSQYDHATYTHEIDRNTKT